MTKKWSEKKGKLIRHEYDSSSKLVSYVTRHIGFKTDAEMMEYIKKHNIKPTGYGYNKENKHFFEYNKRKTFAD